MLWFIHLAYTFLIGFGREHIACIFTIRFADLLACDISCLYIYAICLLHIFADVIEYQNMRKELYIFEYILHVYCILQKKEKNNAHIFAIVP